MNEITLDQLVIFAARSGNLKLLEERISMGGNINIVDEMYGSPLSEAIRCVKEEIVDFLIEKGADVNIEYHDGIGPLEISLRTPNPKIVYKLICSGAHLKRKTQPYYSQRLEKCMVDIAKEIKRD